ncbi:MAG: type II toxin-antitoxin system RelE/ParE family toxin [Hyphomicrobiales bacterium]|nr:MAG: type II toxin-antitoxin system RelE/ParE family toxin [Hyphomicrobiales bacterium]
MVRYSPRAEADLYEIWLTIAQDSEKAADALVHRLANKASLAAGMPLIGVARPELGPHARILIEGRYVIIYEPQTGGIAVIAVVHGMRDPENWLN